MAISAASLTESKGEYVRRKVERERKDYTRMHEFEGIPIDKDEMEHHLLEVKHDAEDWWDAWEF